MTSWLEMISLLDSPVAITATDYVFLPSHQKQNKKTWFLIDINKEKTKIKRLLLLKLRFYWDSVFLILLYCLKFTKSASIQKISFLKYFKVAGKFLIQPAERVTQSATLRHNFGSTICRTVRLDKPCTLRPSKKKHLIKNTLKKDSL